MIDLNEDKGIELAEEVVKNPATVHPTLRHAGLNDIPKIIDISQKLYQKSGLTMFNVDRKKAIETLEEFIITGQTEYLVLLSVLGDDIVGVLAAYAFKPLFSSDKLAVECLWWLDEEHRTTRRGLDMMNAYEYWARMIGCKAAQYGVLATSPRGLEKLYLKRGAEFTESVYTLELK